eukprot:c46748_g1_i1 orf=61-243(+)
MLWSNIKSVHQYVSAKQHKKMGGRFFVWMINSIKEDRRGSFKGLSILASSSSVCAFLSSS